MAKITTRKALVQSLQTLAKKNGTQLISDFGADITKPHNIWGPLTADSCECYYTNDLKEVPAGREFYGFNDGKERKH